MIIPIKPWLERESISRRGGLAVLPVVSGGSPFERPSRGMIEQEDESSPASSRLWESYSSPDMEFYHQPILGERILEAMQPIEGKQIFDGTLGGGGHSELFLENGAHVIGCDRDAAAIEYAGSRLSRFGDRFLPVRGNFAALDEILDSLGIDRVDGILLDIGVSSRQLDDAARGFSFREEGDLDMRMDDRELLTAAAIVNEWDEAELARIFFVFGEEKKSRRIAAAIVAARAKSPLRTTKELADLVASVVPKAGRNHPATRVFQAIRIAVNGELDAISTALEKSVDRLAPGGILAVITFHSLEDRIVKRFLQERSRPTIDRPEWPAPRDNPDFFFTLPERRPVAPDEEEQSANPRSRSAKLRIAVRNDR